MDRYLELYYTREVQSAQKQYYGRPDLIDPQPERDPLGAKEMEFLPTRDSFYMATVNSEGWPYLQHRGGKPGFLKVLDPHTLAFADFKGNRQLLSTGNLSQNDRVALFFMDYPRRRRLKMLGRARVEDVRHQPDVVAQFANPDEHRFVERVFYIDVVSYDWNCPKYITPRFTEEEMSRAGFTGARTA